MNNTNIDVSIISIIMQSNDNIIIVIRSIIGLCFRTWQKGGGSLGKTPVIWPSTVATCDWPG